jgi:DNA-binding response OmpR family regulator
LSAQPLAGTRILILEDEFLIALDVEELCRDSGAAEVVIMRSLDELGPDPLKDRKFDAAVIDLKLGSTSTIEFAQSLFRNGIPFLFATGYSNPEEIGSEFPGVTVIGKPYIGTELIEALVAALNRRDEATDT